MGCPSPPLMLRISTSTGRPAGMGWPATDSLTAARIKGSASGEKTRLGMRSSPANNSGSMRCRVGIVSCYRKKRLVGVSGDLETGEVGGANPAPVVQWAQRQIGGHAAMGILVPVGHGVDAPGRTPVQLVDFRIVKIVDVLADTEALAILADQLLETLADVACLVFRIDHEASRDHVVRVRSVDHEQVGECRNGHAQIGA